MKTYDELLKTGALYFWYTDYHRWLDKTDGDTSGVFYSLDNAFREYSKKIWYNVWSEYL